MRGAQPDQALRQAFARATDLAAGTAAIVALSGGSDSVALAALAAAYAAETGARLTFVHVNHQTRPSAAQDEAVALAVGTALAAPVEIRRLAAGSADEATLRGARYDALIEVARERNASRVLTGHTADDQTETVLLALFRGTGRDGLTGMPPQRELAPGLILERPLLGVTRVSLRRHCERRQLPYAIDPTNDCPEYRRNAVRQALSGLRPLFPELDAAVARCARLLREEVESPEAAAIARTLREWLAEHGVASDISSERLGRLVQMVELGRGRRVRLILEKDAREADSP